MSLRSFFYKKSILKEHELQLSEQNIHCDDIGFFSAYKNHNLKFNHISIDNELDWKAFNRETLILVILNLMLKKAITVSLSEFKEEYFGGANTIVKRLFLVNLNNNQTSETDLLSATYLKVLKKMSRSNDTIKFHESIFSLFDSLIGERESYVKPEKKLFVENLNRYVKKHDWINLKEDYNLLGPLFKYNLSIEPIYIPRLKMQHEALYNYHAAELKSNVAYKQLYRRLNAVMEFNYQTRFFLQNSNSSRRYGNPEFPIPSVY